MNPLVSILLPTYKRIARAEQCIRSIVDSCDDPNQIEICLRLQSNDPDSIRHTYEFMQLAPVVGIVIGLPYGGYMNNTCHFQDVET